MCGVHVRECLCVHVRARSDKLLGRTGSDSRTSSISSAGNPRGPGTADGREPSGVRGQDAGGQDGGRAETGPGPGSARQDQPDRAGSSQKAAADRR